MRYPLRPSYVLLAVSGLLLTLVLLPAQTKDIWAPVSPEELALKQHPVTPGAPAMILYRETHTDDTKSFETHYFRIKIFNEDGKKYADIEIPYLEKQFQVEEIRARTVRPDGAAVDFHGLIFDKVIIKAKKLKFQAKTFTLPGVEAGSIIEYAYKMKWRQNLPDVLRNPGEYIVEGVFAIPTARWTMQRPLFTRRARFSLQPLPKAQLQWASVRLRDPSALHRQPDGTIQLELENIPELQDEDHMPPEDTLTSRVHFFYVVGFAGSPQWFWSQHAKQRAEIIEKFIGKSKSMERAVRQIVAPNDPPETKLRKLYAQVQQIRYVSYESPKTDKEQKRENLSPNKSAEDVLTRGYAFGNEINLLFVALARAAGFVAAPVQVVSRESGVFEPAVFDASQLDAMVVWVRLGSKDLYFDPATRFCPYGLLPWEETDAQGIRLDTGSMVATPSTASDSAVVERKAKLQLDADGALHGQLQVSFTGQEALTRRLGAYAKDDAGRRKAMEEEIKSWLPPGASIELEGATNWEHSEEPLRVQCRVRIPHLATVTARRILFPAAIFHANRRNSFHHARRVHPVSFPHPYREVDHLSVDLPGGFLPESLPVPRHDTTEFSRFQTAAETLPGRLLFQRHFALERIQFPVNSYGGLRVFFGKVRVSDEEKVVLQSAQTAQRD